MKKKTDNLEMYPPQTTYYNRLKAIMERDDEITTDFDYDASVITISIANAPKAAAWRQILPETKVFGNEEVAINIFATKEGIDSNIIATAFSGNRSFDRLEHVSDPKQMIDRWYCVMQPELIQFYNDNFGSLYSIETATPEELCKEVFDIAPTTFCTERIINE